jgi:hypothetical protein
MSWFAKSNFPIASADGCLVYQWIGIFISASFLSKRLGRYGTYILAEAVLRIWSRFFLLKAVCSLAFANDLNDCE